MKRVFIKFKWSEKNMHIIYSLFNITLHYHFILYIYFVDYYDLYNYWLILIKEWIKYLEYICRIAGQKIQFITFSYT